MDKQYMEGQEISLNRYLREYITVTSYFQVVGQIATMLYKVQREGLQIALDAQMMQVQNGKVGFQMTMEDSVYELEKIITFFKELTFNSIFAGEEDCREISEFLHFLDNRTVCASLESIQKYCTGHSGQQGQYSAQQNMRADQLNTQPQMRVQGQYQSQQSMQSGQLNTQSQMRVPQSTRSGQLNMQSADGETGVLGAGFWENLEQQGQPGNNSNGETGVLDPSFWEKAIQNTPSTRLDNGASANVVYGKLINVKTGQATLINRENFWVGKEDVDLQISKDIISRRHAVVMCKENHFFVSDNDSTNKTYVNNKEIPPKASVEIFNGTRIKFANEEYEFQI